MSEKYTVIKYDTWVEVRHKREMPEKLLARILTEGYYLNYINTSYWDYTFVKKNINHHSQGGWQGEMTQNDVDFFEDILQYFHSSIASILDIKEYQRPGTKEREEQERQKQRLENMENSN